MTAEKLAFFALAALTLIPALLVVRARNIVHAGYWLFPCFIGVAGMFAALEAHFFFVVQLLIYAGAILVLILFALMLTRDVMNPDVSQTNRYSIRAAFICAVLAVGSGWVLARNEWNLSTERPAAATEQARQLGNALIQNYAMPFEVASLLLLAALMGAVVLAKSEREPAPPLPPLADELVEEEELVTA